MHAPQPDQTVNLDLCVVPLTHAAPTSWVSVSLHQAATGTPPVEPAGLPPVAPWPGQAFFNPRLSDGAQLRTYAEQRTAQRRSKGQRKPQRRENQAARSEGRAQSEELRWRHRRRRLARQRGDTVWPAQRHTQREFKRTWKALSPQERSQRRIERRTRWADWRAARAAGHAQMQPRAAEDALWRQDRQALRRQRAELTLALPRVTGWLAILVVGCNGTHRGLGLLLFTAGVHVTAEMIVAALGGLCLAELEFLITDNGAQFIAAAFAQFVKEHAWVHVRIAPRRPCTHGIAERFVRTLKEWLATQTWTSADEVTDWLTTFITYSNNRPHQGAELHGLSPNEFARRCRHCSRC